MASPQLENGFTSVANEIIDALGRIRIRGEAIQVLWVIFRKTYGWHKLTDDISLSQFVEATGINKRNVSRAIRILRDMNLIIIQKDNESLSKKITDTVNYRFNKDFETWKPLSKKITLSKKIICVIQKDNFPLSKKTNTKETITKETIQKKIYMSDSDEIRLSTYLFKYIERNNPNAKKPNFNTWAKTFDLMLRVDKRPLEEIKELIRWCQKDVFWFKVILSPGNMKKHYDRMALEKNKACPDDEDSRKAAEAFIRERNNGEFNGFD